MEAVLIPVVWSLIAGACFALGVVYLVAWFNRVGEREYLAFFALAMSLGALTLGELAIMRSSTPQEAGLLIRWMHVPITTTVLSIVAFMHFYIGSRRLWLGYLACGLRLAALVLNFYFEPNLNFTSITELHTTTLLGEPAIVPVGIPNPWMIVGQLSSVALLLFAIDATVAGWRKSNPIERRRALLIGGSLVLFVLTAAGYSALVTSGVVRFVFLFSLPTFVVLLAMASELAADTVRSLQFAARLERSEAQLRQSEQRMQRAAEAAKVGSWEWDIARDDIWASEQTRALFGFPPKSRIDFQRFADTLRIEDRPAVFDLATRLRQQGGTFEQGYQVNLPKGHTRWVFTRGDTEVDTHGRPVLVRGVSIDVTDRRFAEMRYHRLVEDAPYGLLVADMRGVVESGNVSAALIFGYPREELHGLSLDVLIPGSVDAFPGTRERAEDVLPPQLRRQMTARRKDGTTRTLEVTLGSIEGPRDVALLAMVVDVSELKLANEQIERERAFLRQVIDTIPGLIFAKDRQGRFTLANHAMSELFACPVAHLIGKSDADLNPNADEVRHFRSDDLEVMETRRQRLIAEEPVTGADGQTRWWMTVKVPIIDKEGNCDQVLGSSIDITVRKRAELQVEQQRNELAHLSRVTMLSELSGSLTHELNQPLAAILSNAQAALRFLAVPAPNLDEVREILRDIVSDDRRAGEVIRSLRQMLKRGEMKREELDVNGLVRDVLKLVRGDVLNAGVALTVDLAPTLSILSGDRVQLQQVLLNLIVNGCEAMSTVALPNRQLRVTTQQADGSEVCLGVCDTGSGIPAGDIERVFEPFYTTKPQGLGLGLSVCRRIITAHGGRLWADNNANGGSTFFITLPRGDVRRAA